MNYFRLLSFLLLNFFIFTNSQAQDSIPLNEQKVTIGITQTPPFIIKNGDSYSGLSVSSWKLVNDELEMDYEFREYASLSELLTAVEENEVDFSINPITVTNSRMNRMDFSQPYFISYTGMAKKQQNEIWAFIKNIMSWNFLSALLLLLGIIFIFGFFVWIFERKKNEEEFGGGKKGIMQGFWWSAVTMTTVGYGDKSPKTTGGRVVGLVWMFLAIILISSLTAGIASALTVHNISSDINSVADLENFSVATVAGSSSQEFLELYNIQNELVKNEEEGIDLLMQEQVDIFVYDQPILQHEVAQKGLEDDVEILQRTLKKDYYSYSFPTDSELVEIIDPVLVGILKTMEWNNLVREYN